MTQLVYRFGLLDMHVRLIHRVEFEQSHNHLSYSYNDFGFWNDAFSVDGNRC